MRKIILTLIVCAVAAAPLPAFAQSAPMLVVGNDLARTCYVSALTAIKTGVRWATNGISDCDAALAGPLNGHDRAATYNNRGVLHDMRQQYELAWADFDACLKLNDQVGDAYLNRGVALIRMKKPGEALDDIRRAMALGASMPEIGYYDLGVAEQNMGQLTEAYHDFQKALAADPDFKPAAQALENFTVTRAPAGAG